MTGNTFCPAAVARAIELIRAERLDCASPTGAAECGG
jgi:hypothetical protein